jgi:hypothetical protein
LMLGLFSVLGIRCHYRSGQQEFLKLTWLGTSG